MAGYRKLVSDSRDKGLYPEIVRNIAQYKDVDERMNVLFEQGQKLVGYAIMNNSSTPIYCKLQDQIKELTVVNAMGIAKRRLARQTTSAADGNTFEH